MTLRTASHQKRIYISLGVSSLSCPLSFYAIPIFNSQNFFIYLSLFIFLNAQTILIYTVCVRGNFPPKYFYTCVQCFRMLYEEVIATNTNYKLLLFVVVYKIVYFCIDKQGQGILCLCTVYQVDKQVVVFYILPLCTKFIECSIENLQPQT